MSVYKKVEALKVVPVVVIENAEHAIPLGNTLMDAGLPLIEITFRTAAAAKAIINLRNTLPDLLIGAGTVLTVDQVKDAIGAGAEFIVTPGYNPTIVDFCIKKKIPIIPGLNSPSFIEWGLERGLTHFKFYPADLSGGPKMIELLAGPYPTARFMPTGGIDNKTLVEYLKLRNVFACGGSWIVKKDLISAGKFEEIKRLTIEAVSLLKKK